MKIKSLSSQQQMIQDTCSYIGNEERKQMDGEALEQKTTNKITTFISAKFKNHHIHLSHDSMRLFIVFLFCHRILIQIAI